jgi:hypothetical protein
VEPFLSGGAVTSGREEKVDKECRRVNIVQVLCMHVCKWKNETIPGMGKGRDKGE